MKHAKTRQYSAGDGHGSFHVDGGIRCTGNK